VTLQPLKEGGPLKMSIKGDNAIELSDVLVGEVWLCSGQSNMAMTVSRSANFDAEQSAADLPKIRMFTVARKASETAADDCEGRWTVCAPESVGGFSATAYFFGRTLHRELGVPVGLINSSWGGTPVQAWTSPAEQEKLPQLKPLLDDWKSQIAGYDPDQTQARYEKQMARWQEAAKKAKAAGKKPPRRPRPPVDPRVASHRPGNLYNGMIAPLVPYALRGAIWYQGESNANRYDPKLYGLQLKTMIYDWRYAWVDCEMPFLYVQLPNFQAPQQQPVETNGWVIVQEQMLKTLAVPHTGMAVTIDVGEANDIHPKNKQDVGKRLALWALGTTYGKGGTYCGPLFKSAAAKDGALVVEFDHVGDGLVARGDKLAGFALAGADRKFVWADAKIVGDTVEVTSPEVKQPVAVRYAWAANPVGNLTNKTGLPASPFRSDDWEE
jgi:sialate O-acetylesterase